MTTTRAELLVRLRSLDDDEAWSEFHAIYAPILYGFARTRGLCPSDAEDVRDQCLAAVIRRLPAFRYDPRVGRFKGWLFRLASDAVADLRRERRSVRMPTVEMHALPDEDADPRVIWERRWKEEHLRYAMEVARLRISRKTWEIFERLLAGDPVPTICAELSVNRNQVYKARQRALAAIRAVRDGFLGDS